MASHGKATVDLPESQRLQTNNASPLPRSVIVRREPAPPPSRILSTLGIVFFGLATIIPGEYRFRCSSDEQRSMDRFALIANLIHLSVFQFYSWALDTVMLVNAHWMNWFLVI